ncbi:CapA family protein [Nonomuraea turcica]|uniref:CapA family protein n=1 Tax=Nonomuraea sp. G32 TaxID=3067274 RepID=UPI00273B5B00|nr:CapA family protein [Nonomuraea sp. G32]MDP4505604.1 CapA family protein [Nonomuraea sp. G32]
MGKARHLPEPVPLGWSDAGREVRVRLMARLRNRLVMHSAGDVMFGRRYETPPAGHDRHQHGGPPPDPGQTPLVPRWDAADGARRVVSSIAPVFRAADLRTVNLETVLSDRPAGNAYPGKRYVLRSATASVAGLRALGVDVAVLANNHTRDFLDGGVADTRAALAKAGVAAVGAGPDPQQAAVPYLRRVAGVDVAMVAYTSVDGSFVNDHYPHGPAVGDTSAKAGWQTRPRLWGFSGGGVTIPQRPRRIGDAWQAYRDMEPRLVPRTAAAVWASLQKVYPELQDWVARRGHGGPAMWDPRTSLEQVRRLARQAKLVVVQCHSGFQFQDASSENLRAMARQAIDAGADIVIAHHPHVLQGMEWYKGRLIAYSLGNFAFDQNFHATFPSTILRTVWDGDRLVQARAIPVELVGYRPVPVVDAAAARAVGRLAERSELSAVATRDASGAVRKFPRTRDAHSRPASFVLEHNTARITADPPVPTVQRVTVTAGGVDRLPADTLSRAQAPVPSGIEMGRDLFGWGGFEDETADPAVAPGGPPPVHWQARSSARVVTGDAAMGRRFLRLSAGGGGTALIRPVARVPLPRHHLYQTVAGEAVPADAEPAYSLRAMVRRSQGASPFARLTAYHFDDTDPTEDPESTQLKTLERPIDVPADERWHQINIDIPARYLDKGNLRGNAAMLYLGMKQSSDGAGRADFDDVELVEWRRPDGGGDFTRYDLVRNSTSRPQELSLQSFRLTAGVPGD